MKTSLSLGIVLLTLLISCEKATYNADNEVLLKTQGGITLKYTDFELYDSSSHIFYLKGNHPEIFSGFNDRFSVIADGQLVYRGIILAPYSSYIPRGPFISGMAGFSPDYFFKIESWMADNSGDLRNDPVLISSLKKHGLFHSGLSINIDNIEINPAQLTFRFTVINTDISDLLILDPEKTGANLFHYFTNGLSLYDSNHNQVFKSTIPHESPASYRSWSLTWLSQLRSGESVQYVIDYPLSNSIPSGVYHASFEFPGFHFQIPREQLYQNNDRIWLGELQVNREITIK